MAAASHDLCRALLIPQSLGDGTTTQAQSLAHHPSSTRCRALACASSGHCARRVASLHAGAGWGRRRGKALSRNRSWLGGLAQPTPISDRVRMLEVHCARRTGIRWRQTRVSSSAGLFRGAGSTAVCVPPGQHSCALAGLALGRAFGCGTDTPTARLGLHLPVVSPATLSSVDGSLSSFFTSRLRAETHLWGFGFRV